MRIHLIGSLVNMAANSDGFAAGYAGARVHYYD